jgi:hypothetical protein
LKFPFAFKQLARAHRITKAMALESVHL